MTIKRDVTRRAAIVGAAAADELADAHAAVSYEPPLAVLQNWTEPAASYRGAVEALRLAREEVETFGAAGAGTPMIAAALAYLER